MRQCLGSLVPLVAMALVPTTVSAVPITYTVSQAGIAARLGTTSWDNATVTIDFYGDTNNVQSFTHTDPSGAIDAAGFWNRVGTAIVTIFHCDASGQCSSHSATFTPAAGIFVSVDQTNYGAGVGSIWSPTYPLSAYGNADFRFYDLTSSLIQDVGWTPFCPNFNSCNASPLPTTAGDFAIWWPYMQDGIPRMTTYFGALVSCGPPGGPSLVPTVCAPSNCVDLANDASNCGACSHACPQWPTGGGCIGGTCCIRNTSCTGRCGTVSDGCGGTVSCPACNPYYCPNGRRCCEPGTTQCLFCVGPTQQCP